jgi:hypothetical protein
MTTFDERERAFEAKFAHDEEFRYLVGGRRDRLFAGWIARRLGLNEASTEALVADMLHVSDGAGHDDRLINLAADALIAHGQVVSDADLRTALAQCAVDAKQQLMEMAKPG